MSRRTEPTGLPKGVTRGRRVETFAQEMDSDGPVGDESGADESIQILRVETRDGRTGT